MISYIVRRLLYSLVLVAIITVVAYGIIELPPGDYLTTRIQQLESQGATLDRAEIAALRRQFGLDLPVCLRQIRRKVVRRFSTGLGVPWRRTGRSPS